MAEVIGELDQCKADFNACGLAIGQGHQAFLSILDANLDVSGSDEGELQNALIMFCYSQMCSPILLRLILPDPLAATSGWTMHSMGTCSLHPISTGHGRC